MEFRRNFWWSITEWLLDSYTNDVWSQGVQLFLCFLWYLWNVLLKIVLKVFIAQLSIKLLRYNMVSASRSHTSQKWHCSMIVFIHLRKLKNTTVLFSFTAFFFHGILFRFRLLCVLYWTLNRFITHSLSCLIFLIEKYFLLPYLLVLNDK